MILIQDHHTIIDHAFIGSKAKNLSILSLNNFLVPQFAVISGETISKAMQNTQLWESIQKEIMELFPSQTFIIRSAALMEDGTNNAYAGQFKSIKIKKPSEFIHSVQDIILHAQKHILSDYKKLSLIVQEYIDADYGGVCFTRNPSHGHEMQIEYVESGAHAVVSGEVIAKRISFSSPKYTTQFIPHIQSSAFFTQMRHIEQLFKFPQDIEWASKNDALYILQSRNITTLSQNQYEAYLLIDSFLDNQTEAISLKKTELYDSVPRPTFFMGSLLLQLFSEDGPVKKSYKKTGLDYFSTDQFKILGGELFSNISEELKTVFPAYQYDHQTHTFGWRGSFRSLFSTIKNKFRMQWPFLPKRAEQESIYQDLLNAFNTKTFSTYADWETSFLKIYQTVYFVNIVSLRAMSFLQKIAPSVVYETHKNPFFNSKDQNLLSQITNQKDELVGNTIDISSQSKFQTGLDILKIENTSIDLQGISKLKETLTIQVADVCRDFEFLRELSRWVSVYYINLLRTLLHAIYDETNIPYELLTHASRDELLRNQFDKATLQSRKELYESQMYLDLPSKIFTWYPPKNNPDELLCISEGETNGKLITFEAFLKQKPEVSVIIYTQTLNPDLVSHFPFIKGIISSQGSILSHLGIMARQSNIPVISNATLSKDFFDSDSIFIKSSPDYVTIQISKT